MTVADAMAAFLAANGIQYVFTVGGHGNTPLLEALAPYAKQGKIRVVDVQHEAIAAHSATALKWMHGIESAVITSIGPGWFNTLLAQNTAMSNGYGYLIIAGDKTTAYEGPNMQQILRDGQFGFVRAAEAVSKKAYTIVDPKNIYTVMREALAKTREPGSAGPVNVFVPMNLQSAKHAYNLDLLHRAQPLPVSGMRPAAAALSAAVAEILRHKRIAIRVGGGAVGAGAEIKEFASMVGAAVVMGPVAMDAVESSFEWNVGPGGSKGSISGNAVCEKATLLVNAGGRGVCQSDCSGTLYVAATNFININLNSVEALRYDGLPLTGDVKAVLRDLIDALVTHKPQPCPEWRGEVAAVRAEWKTYLAGFYAHPVIDGKLTQPAAIKAVDDHVNSHRGIRIFDAGDVQAHGFQIASHFGTKTYLSDTGNSCMGFGISAAFGLGLIHDGAYPVAFTGDGSFLMQAQAIRDMVKHRANCTVVVFDNQAMGAITALQWAQNFAPFATEDPAGVPAVDFVKLAESMGCAGFRAGATIDSLVECVDRAHKHNGPAVVDVKVYFGKHQYGALGAFGRWSVGPWSETVESIWEGKS